MLHEEDKLIICPYNPAHTIRPKRMQFHLLKCRKNYPTQDYAICPIDVTHHVPQKEFKLHLETCSKRSVVDRVLVEQKTERSNIAPPLPQSVVQSLLPPTEESWDDVEYPTYVPDLSQKAVFRTLKNAPRAQKKEFQLSERRRLLDLQEKERATGPIQTQQACPQTEDGIRMPKNQSQASQQRLGIN